VLLGALAVWLGYLTWDRFAPGPGNVKPRDVTPRGELAEFEKTNIRLFQQARDSVVSVDARLIARTSFRLRLTEIEAGAGTGIVWDQAGHIITNFHVVQLAAGPQQPRIRVTMANGNSYNAALVGFAPEHDLALLKIVAPANQLRPIPIGTSNDLQVGQSAFAIGNPFGLEQSLTTGVVSALGREIVSPKSPITGKSELIANVIQTDAAINPGNSGGPLLDSAGRLIGVNTAIASTANQSAGIGFAIPVDTVARAVPYMINKERVPKPLLGVTLWGDDTNRRFGGAVIREVTEASPAEAIGLRGTQQLADGRFAVGDTIVAINDQPIVTVEDLQTAIRKFEVGNEIDVHYERDGKRQSARVKLFLPDR
jgi:S1-C subfamily serine protease